MTPFLYRVRQPLSHVARASSAALLSSSQQPSDLATFLALSEPYQVGSCKVRRGLYTADCNKTHGMDVRASCRYQSGYPHAIPGSVHHCIISTSYGTWSEAQMANDRIGVSGKRRVSSTDMRQTRRTGTDGTETTKPEGFSRVGSQLYGWNDGC